MNDSSNFDAFVHTVVMSIVAGDSPEVILVRAEKLGPWMLPEFVSSDVPEQSSTTVYRVLARHIIDSTPQPALRFATRKLQRPQRNDRCDCGSGRKYKHCCLAAIEHGSPLEHADLLPYVLTNLPRKRWAELVDSAIDPMQVAHTARGMLEEGEVAKVVALLAPWFRASAAIPAVREPMFDVLLDAYDQNRQPRKKKQLLDLALQQGDRVVRSSAHQRLATMAADAGDYAQAWKHFQQAQHHDPDSPSLAHLEIVLLFTQGRPEQARERARFWMARLTRAGTDHHRELITFLSDVVSTGHDALLKVSAERDPRLGLLLQALNAAPAPTVAYRLKQASDDDSGELTPSPALSKALRDWQEHFPQEHPELTFLDVPDHGAWDAPAPWLSLLGRLPLLWQSLEVLDDLVLALGVIGTPFVLPLRERLLERAQSLLELNLQANGGRTPLLAWAWLGNRPALRLIAQRIDDDDTSPPREDTLERMAWMLALNPHDNHGFRAKMLTAHLQLGHYEQALALATRYPDDMLAEMLFGHVLVLYALDRKEEAAAALAHAHASLPRIAPMLLAAKPRRPKLQDGYIAYGGADQAWLYREEALQLWQAHAGALDWLRSWTSQPRSRRSRPTP